jgi:hypothetical protein
MPTAAQLKTLYRVSYQLTYMMKKRLSFKSYLMGSLLMSQIKYDEMSNAELKQYFLKHRGDSFGCGTRRSALQSHLDRINQQPLRIIATPTDPDFDRKVQDAIRQKIEAASNKKLANEIN